MEWTKLEHAFAVEAYFSSGGSIVATQRAFRQHFNIAPRGRVPGRQSIVSWVNNFRKTGDVNEEETWPPMNSKITPKRLTQCIEQNGRHLKLISSLKLVKHKI